ncbi:hypothetical protein BGZ63DRAFT_82491 [Mariannaea sp. PMI_226]|nr:hypothetical protein BGZ63DRAFT_82491 [Mariannaea sp. PMI_226]
MVVEHTAVIATYGLNCPEGGDVYICEGKATEFVGCCTSDPCSDGAGCPAKHLRTLTFNQDKYTSIPALSCDSSGGKEGLWYSCAFTNPPFLGCCDVNACGDKAQQGCPPGHLVAGLLSTNAKIRAKFLSPDNMSESQTTPTILSTSSSASSASTKTTSSAAATSSSASHSGGGLSTGAIVGIAVGVAGVFLLIVGALIWKLCLMTRKRKELEEEANARRQQQTEIPAGLSTSAQPFGIHTPMSYQASSLGSSPTMPQYPSGVSSDLYGKFSPNPSSHGRPVSSIVSDNVNNISPLHNRTHSQIYPQEYSQIYSSGIMVPVQEMDGTSQPPQEMGTGQEHSISTGQEHSSR